MAPLAMPPPPLAPMAGDVAGRGQNPTHISAQRPPGMMVPSTPPPNVQVIDAPPLGKTVALWVVGALTQPRAATRAGSRMATSR